MNLQRMLKEQQDFNEKILGKKISELTDQEKILWSKEYILCLQAEILELLRESGKWKIHRKEQSTVVRSNVLEELTDVFKYFLSMMILHGFTSDDLEFGFDEKSMVVAQRYSQEHKNFKNIVVVDIDGTIGDYVKQFIDFVERRTGFNQIPSELVSMDLYTSLAKAIGWDKVLKLKHEFRINGEKRNIPVMDGAKHFLDTIKKNDHDIIMLTARPFLKYKRTMWDTIYWLNANHLQFDSLLSNEDKYSELIRYIKDIRFMVEDDIGQAKSIATLGIKVYLFNRRYNKCSPLDLVGLDVIRVDSFDEILEKENEK